MEGKYQEGRKHFQVQEWCWFRHDTTFPYPHNTINVFIIFHFSVANYDTLWKKKSISCKQCHFGICSYLFLETPVKLTLTGLATLILVSVKYLLFLKKIFFDFPTNKFYCNTFSHNFFMWLLTLPCKKIIERFLLWKGKSISYQNWYYFWQGFINSGREVHFAFQLIRHFHLCSQL